MCLHLSWCHKCLRRKGLGHDRSFLHLSCPALSAQAQYQGPGESPGPSTISIILLFIINKFIWMNSHFCLITTDRYKWAPAFRRFYIDGSSSFWYFSKQRIVCIKRTGIGEFNIEFHGVRFSWFRCYKIPYILALTFGAGVPLIQHQEKQIHENILRNANGY